MWLPITIRDLLNLPRKPPDNAYFLLVLPVRNLLANKNQQECALGKRC